MRSLRGRPEDMKATRICALQVTQVRVEIFQQVRKSTS